jgi:hypothetical protein
VRQPRGHAFDDPGFLVPGQGPLAALVEQPLEELPPLDVADRLDEAVVVPGEHVAATDEVRVDPQDSHHVVGVEDLPDAVLLFVGRGVDVEVVDLQDGEGL